MNTKLLKELKKQLPKKYTSTLSNECGVSPAIVTKDLKGKIQNHYRIIDDSINLKNKHQDKIKKHEEFEVFGSNTHYILSLHKNEFIKGTPLN